MKHPTITSRIITITLILCLMSMGVVHAETVCDGSCKCHLRRALGGVDFRLSVHALGLLHRGFAIHLVKGANHLAEIDFRDLGCHEGTMKLSCDLVTLPYRYAPQRSPMVNAWSGNSSKVDSILFVSVIHPKETYALGPALSHRLIATKLPDSLYLQHLPLLC